MNSFEIWGLIGEYSINILWLILIIYTLYKSARNKKYIWFSILVINLIIGLNVPLWMSTIIPLIYFLNNLSQKTKNKLKGYDSKKIKKHSSI